MSVVPFQTNKKPEIRRLVAEIEATIDKVTGEMPMTPVELLGALEWVKMNVFYGVRDE